MSPALAKADPSGGIPFLGGNYEGTHPMLYFGQAEVEELQRGGGGGRTRLWPDRSGRLGRPYWSDRRSICPLGTLLNLVPAGMKSMGTT